MQHPSMRTLTLCVAIFIGVSFTEAKRGCSSFGHSCFGGHGKRSDGIGALGNGPSLRGLQSDTLLGQQSKYGQDEVAMPKPIYPQSSNMDLGNGDDIIPIRNGDNGDNFNGDQIKLHLSPYLRHWLIAYRKSQENNDEYPLNNYI